MLQFSAFLLAVGVRIRNPLRYHRLIGKNIRKHRKRVGWSQERLAEKSDLHPVYFGQVERGKQVITDYALVGVAKALKVKLADLVVGI